jgi:hypothetical protein
MEDQKGIRIEEGVQACTQSCHATEAKATSGKPELLKFESDRTIGYHWECAQAEPAVKKSYES